LVPVKLSVTYLDFMGGFGGKEVPVKLSVTYPDFLGGFGGKEV